MSVIQLKRCAFCIQNVASRLASAEEVAGMVAETVAAVRVEPSTPPEAQGRGKRKRREVDYAEPGLRGANGVARDREQ